MSRPWPCVEYRFPAPPSSPPLSLETPLSLLTLDSHIRHSSLPFPNRQTPTERDHSYILLLYSLSFVFFFSLLGFHAYGGVSRRIPEASERASERVRKGYFKKKKRGKGGSGRFRRIKGDGGTGNLLISICLSPFFFILPVPPFPHPTLSSSSHHPIIPILIFFFLFMSIFLAFSLHVHAPIFVFSFFYIHQMRIFCMAPEK